MAELIQLGGLDPKQRHNPAVTEAGLARGATPAPLREAFRAVAARPGAPRPPPLTYFEGAVTDQIERSGQNSPPLACGTQPSAPPEDPIIATARAQNRAMWDRFIQDGRIGPCPPSVSRWLAGCLHDADLWLRYPTEGASVFRGAA